MIVMNPVSTRHTHPNRRTIQQEDGVNVNLIENENPLSYQNTLNNSTYTHPYISPGHTHAHTLIHHSFSIGIRTVVLTVVACYINLFNRFKQEIVFRSKGFANDAILCKIENKNKNDEFKIGESNSGNCFQDIEQYSDFANKLRKI